MSMAKIGWDEISHIELAIEIANSDPKDERLVVLVKLMGDDAPPYRTNKAPDLEIWDGSPLSRRDTYPLIYHQWVAIMAINTLAEAREIWVDYPNYIKNKISDRVLSDIGEETYLLCSQFDELQAHQIKNILFLGDNPEQKKIISEATNVIVLRGDQLWSVHDFFDEEFMNLDHIRNEYVYGVILDSICDGGAKIVLSKTWEGILPDVLKNEELDIPYVQTSSVLKRYL